MHDKNREDWQEENLAAMEVVPKLTPEVLAQIDQVLKTSVA
jgi:hypothetical protein